MKISSAKAKGKRLELKVAREWRSKIDKTAVPTRGSGNGESFKEDVFTNYFKIECKNQETVKLWAWWDQARRYYNASKPPVLAISGNYRPILVVMDLDDWLNLVKEAKIE